MKQNLKRVLSIFPLMVILLINHSCSKNIGEKEECSIYGSDIGYNPDKCGCCPGWLKKHENDTLKFLTVPGNNIL